MCYLTTRKNFRNNFLKITFPAKKHENLPVDIRGSSTKPLLHKKRLCLAMPRRGHSVPFMSLGKLYCPHSFITSLIKHTPGALQMFLKLSALQMFSNLSPNSGRNHRRNFGELLNLYQTKSKRKLVIFSSLNRWTRRS